MLAINSLRDLDGSFTNLLLVPALLVNFDTAKKIERDWFL
jgi:hypothetical protein